MKHIKPLDQVYWYLTKEMHELRSRCDELPGCVPSFSPEKTVEVLIIGGGMAGISAAQAFREKGCSVVLIEKHFCGSGASGRSSGFITPDSEFALSDFIERYGEQQGNNIWQFGLSGVEAIRNNIETYTINCDYQVQDTLVVANTAKAFNNDIEAEHHKRIELGYDSRLYNDKEISSVIGGSSSNEQSKQPYFGGVRYTNTFGINSYQYLQSMKRILEKQGIEIYEEVPALALEKAGNATLVKTPYGTIRAVKTIICMDFSVADLHHLEREVYHAQTFLLASAPLTDAQVKAIFPERPLMVWDTDLIYQYFRLIGSNRLLVGGSSIPATYAAHAEHDKYSMYKKLKNYIDTKFPESNIVFEYMWPGLIGVSKDIIPLAGRDEEHQSLYYIAGAAGLPWAAALGHYAAEVMIDDRSDLNSVFSPYRSFKLGSTATCLLGKRLSFALSHLLSVRTM